jgi:hypothetical protein
MAKPRNSGYGWMRETGQVSVIVEIARPNISTCLDLIER